MFRLCKWKWGILVCVFAIAVGVLHGMTHVEFHDGYARFMNDSDKLVELFVEYVWDLIFKMGYVVQTDKLEKVTEHYDQMMTRAQPLQDFFAKDMEKLCHYMDTLESIQMMKKFFYSYCRQSAINLMNHLKSIYHVDCE